MLKLPELLCPAGSADAFRAAIDGGADAIYVGGTSFNARINAKNLSDEELLECIKLAHIHGVKVYITLNTMVYEREHAELLRAAETYAKMGTDAFIVADLGVASLLHSALPDVQLHASTQLAAHSAAAGHELAGLGFSRLVPARELCADDIRTLVTSNPLEVEIFTHGALCVCHSGQCLFSSIVGGRSGNRGLCAQPCRLPYSHGGKVGRNSYPLSLKDLSLAEHITEIFDLGVHSLKIEGRMKSPEYVRAVASVWRRLLDERRNATPDEMRELSDIFSRSGFTDAYFTGKAGTRMLGVRSESDKLATQKAGVNITSRRTPIDAEVRILCDRPATITLTCRGVTVTEEGYTPQGAINAPISEDTVRRSISKLGNTPFELSSLSITLNDGLMLPVSQLNELRRAGIDALSDALTRRKDIEAQRPAVTTPRGERQHKTSARFLCAEQITPAAKEYFDITLLPLDRYSSAADGFVVPPVVFDSERDEISRLIDHAISLGATHAAVGNIGALSLVRGKGLTVIADIRFNAASTQTVAILEKLGARSVILSPELSLPQMRDISGDVAAVVYGRLPLMVLEKCVIRDTYGCEECKSRSIYEPVTLTDRKGISFPVYREWQHRSVIYNSLPTCMSDKKDALEKANITSRHFIFTSETPSEVDHVIHAHRQGLPLGKPVRRI